MMTGRYLSPRFALVAAAVMFAAGAILVSLAPGAASTGTQLSPGSGSSSPGGSFSTSASVSLAAADELNGFDITVSYNAAVAVPVSVTLNGSWTIPLDPGTVGPSTVHVAASRLGTFCTGTCPLFTINWSAAGAGNFALSPTSYTLVGRQGGAAGNLSQVAVVAGTISVAGAVPTASNTSVPPTNTPTNTPVQPSVTSTPTRTPVPPTDTSTPTKTPDPTTGATPVPSAAAVTPTAVPPTASQNASASTPTTAPSTPIPPASERDGSPPQSPDAGSTVPAVIATTAASPEVIGEAPSAPAPAAPVTVVVPGPATATGPAGQFGPLPPRTGDGTRGATNSGVQQAGIALMVGSGLLFAAGVAASRAQASARWRRVVGRYLEQSERDGRRR